MEPSSNGGDDDDMADRRWDGDVSGGPQVIDWNFFQVFGERENAAEEVQDADIISAIEFSRDGRHLGACLPLAGRRAADLPSGRKLVFTCRCRCRVPPLRLVVATQPPATAAAASCSSLRVTPPTAARRAGALLSQRLRTLAPVVRLLVVFLTWSRRRVGSACVPARRRDDGAEDMQVDGAAPARSDVAVPRSKQLYRYVTEFQSHEPEFDYLKSLDIEEKINKIRCAPPPGLLRVLAFAHALPRRVSRQRRACSETLRSGSIVHN
eukprot:scaffold659_cov329-Prasinococcus_capsulatus_cf.AAC.5